MFRWYTNNKYSWYWDSRNDCYYKSCVKTKSVLQYLKDGKWITVPSIVEEYTPPKPKD